MQGYTLYVSRECKGRNELGVTWDESLQECMESCNSNQFCISFEFAQNHNGRGRTLCQLSSSCTAELRVHSTHGFDLYVNALHKDKYVTLPSNGKCSQGTELTEEECKNLGGGGVFANWWEAGTWDLPETCGCYIDQNGYRYFNRLTGACNHPDTGEKMICKGQSSSAEKAVAAMVEAEFHNLEKSTVAAQIADDEVNIATVIFAVIGGCAFMYNSVQLVRKYACEQEWTPIEENDV